MSPDTAERLVAGRLCDGSWDAAQKHMASCSDCRQLISELARPLAAPSSAPRSEFTVGRYRVLMLLGEGGMGQVFEAYDPQLRRAVAIKVLHQDSRRGNERLLREAQMLARLTHPNIVEIHDVGVEKGSIYIAMDLVLGDTIPAWLAGTRPSWREIVAVFTQAAAGLAAAHRAGVVHRDFKPSNVMLGADGRVRVLDFGLARAFEDRTDAEAGPGTEPSAPLTTPSRTPGYVTATGVLVGTPAYLAPEQYRREPADGRTDQFAFCVSLYEALYGKRPFVASTSDGLEAEVTAGRVAPRGETEVPAWLHRVISRGLAANPDARWPDMATLMRRLGGERPRAVRRTLTVAALVALGLLGAFAPEVAAFSGGDAARSIPVAALQHATEVDPVEKARLRVEVARILDLRDESHLAEAIALANAIEPEVVALGDNVLLAELYFRRGAALISDGKPAQEDFLRAYDLAEGANDLDLAARCALELAVGTDPDGTDSDNESARWLGLAEALTQRLGEPAPLMLELHQAKGRIIESQGDFATALTEYEHASALARETLLPDSSQLASHLDDHAQALRLVGELDAALDLYDEALAIHEASVGPNHPYTASSIEQSAHALSTMGRTEDAADRYRRSLEIRERVLGPDHSEVSASLTNLGGHLLALDRVEEAVAMLRRAREIDARQGPLGPSTVPLLNNLGHAYLAIDKPRDAAEAFARGAEIVLERHGADHPSRGPLVGGLAQASVQLQLWPQAVDAATEALRIRDLHQPDDPRAAFALLALGRAQQELGDHDAAQRALTQARKRAVAMPGGAPDVVAEVDKAILEN